MTPTRAAIQITAIYLCIGLAWIFFSDHALGWFVKDPSTMLRLQTLKGLAYVMFTGLLFGLLAWRTLLKQQQLHERDALTGLLNWYMFRDGIDEHVQAAKRENEQLALAVVNIDGFRQFNSQVGQRNGDLLLQYMAEKLRAECPIHAALGRVSADEFCIALRGHNAFEELESVMVRVQADIRQSASHLLQTNKPHLAVTCSVGIAAFPLDASHSKELIAAANLALAEAKDLGFGHCCSYRQSYSDSVRHRAQLIRDLDQAITQASSSSEAGTESELFVVYQPQLSASSTVPVSAEALLRWSHPLHGSIPPDEFIQLAEQHGLITRLTNFVCKQVINECVRTNLFNELEYVSINISAHDINSKCARQEFAQRFEQDPNTMELLKAGRFQLEITETALMQNKRYARTLLKQLRQQGYRLAIDDFGTGYSSLSVISQLPVNELKIDRSFIGELSETNTESNDALIVRTIIAMAHALNLQVVAEGVETEYHASLLSALECDRLQGYYLGRPVPILQFKALYGSGHSSTQSSD